MIKKCVQRSKQGVIMLFVCGLSVIVMTLHAEAQETAGAVWGEFRNQLAVAPGTNPPAQQSSSATCFGGHVGGMMNAQGVVQPPPQAGGVILMESSFGQSVAYSVPYPNFQQDAIDRSLKMLYYEHADNTPDFLKDEAAYRYKALLYETDDTNNVSAQFLKMSELWTAAERQRALDAGAIVRAAMKYDPFYPGLRNALLDIYYDFAVADMSKATEKRVEAVKYALELPGYIAPPGEFQISEEIRLLDEALPLYDTATRPYFDLLQDPMGINMNRIDPTLAAQGVPFGFYLFKTEVPGRSLYALLYRKNDELLPVLDEDGNNQPDVLFAGYKDLVLLFRLEKDAAQTAAKLAKLYALRSAAGDAQSAYQVIGDAQQKAYTDGSVLNGIFSAAELGQVDTNSGLVEAQASWAQGLSSLSGVKGFLDGDANLLGLDKGFLALIQTDIPGGNNVHRDSFNYFADMLIPNGASPSGALQIAKEKYDLAYAQYEKVQVNKDTIKSELQTERRQFGDRLFAIAGAEYGSPEYATPETNEGSEIYQQLQNIELAQLRIQHNQQEIDNLEQQILNEIERRGKQHDINDLIAKTYIRYGNKQTKLTERIGAIRAVAAAANAMAAGFSSPQANLCAAAANAAAQAAAAIAESQLQAEKERLQAEQSAEITYLSDQLAAGESEMLVRNLLLGMHTLAIESQEAAIMLAQEMGRLQSLLDEKAYLEAQWAEAEQELGTRYFADPSHRIIMDQFIIDADFAFQEAQFWVYVLARALDYKWNYSFITTFGGKTYTSSTVFALRNAPELVEMAQALWNYDQTQNIGTRQGTQFVKFSFREDFLGYRRLDENGQTAYYPDPQTGQMVTALEAFHSYLKYVAPHYYPGNHLTDFSEVVHLEFDTVRTNPQGTFFSSSRWNEKMKWISVKLNAESGESEVMVYLEQSGMGYVRNSERGVRDPDHPDQISGEMTGYPIRYWYQNQQSEWIMKDTFGFGINAVITIDPYAPVVSWQKTEFHEMPPAVSKWVLEVPLKGSSGWTLLNPDKITDIEIWFYNYYYARNSSKTTLSHFTDAVQQAWQGVLNLFQ